MEAKNVIRSYIERTNPVAKNEKNLEIKEKLQNSSNSPTKIVKKSINLTLSASQGHMSSAKSIGKESPQKIAFLDRKSLGFIKDMSHTLNEMIDVNDKRFKRISTLSRIEEEKLKQAKSLIKEHLKSKKITKVEDTEKDIEYFNIVAKESAESLLELENKRKELAEENEKLAKILGENNQGQNKNYKICEEIQKILQKILQNFPDHAEKEVNINSALRFRGNYPVSINALVEKWNSSLVNPNFAGLSKDLANKIAETQSQHKISKEKLDNIIHDLKNKYNHLLEKSKAKIN